MARPWSPSLELIERMIGEILGLLGELGQVRPEEHARHGGLDGLERAAIGVARLGVEGVGLARAPDIQSRMHDLRRFGCPAVSAARASIQPEAEAPRAPAAASRITCRRVSCGDMAVRATHGDTPFAPERARVESKTGYDDARRWTADTDDPAGQRQWFR